MVAPADLACAMTASTSSCELTLWPIENSVALFAPMPMPASRAKLARGQSARRRPVCRSKNATAPCSNFLADDARGGKAETIAVEADGRLQVINTQGQ